MTAVWRDAGTASDWVVAALSGPHVRHAGQKEIAALQKGIVIDGMKYGAIETIVDSSKGSNAWPPSH